MENLLNQLKSQILIRLPRSHYSKLLEKWGQLKLQNNLNNLQKRIFSNIASINLHEMEKPIEDYASLDEFFTRRLKPGIRNINGDSKTIVSPADGRIESFGDLKDGNLIQAKGINYDIHSFLNNQEASQKLKNGKFLTIYLSPHDYHRVHFPLGGKVVDYWHIRGESYPVGSFSRKNIKSLYCKNERVITYVKTKYGLMAVVMVAAMGVGNISLSYLFNPDKSIRDFKCKTPGKPIEVEKGEELGVFHLGSTVVMIFENNQIKWQQLQEEQIIKMGNSVAHFE
ncbi:MAG: archaetidylserine decarboxylase [Deltaproteobacteria bacterium]|jgi:phosphatidylserine decarboxylase|nr:archaetidylserine decarboxylase [Deltaproteobacteria bacterium]